VTTSASVGCQRFFHGTLRGSAGSIVAVGVDYDRIKELGGDGFFWATADVEIARYHASLAEQQLLFTGGPPGQALVAFDLPVTVVENFQSQQPEPWVWVYSHGYKFTPASYSTLNREMKSIEIAFEE
jgi:hypothetical protein